MVLRLPLWLGGGLVAVLAAASFGASANSSPQAVQHSPLTPVDALAAFRVAPGLRVELVAAEPDIVNPVAMTFDERGRIWITESVEYPRRQAGPQR